MQAKVYFNPAFKLERLIFRRREIVVVLAVL